MSATAVTLDAYGTLLHLRDPVPGLAGLLSDAGYANPEPQVRAGVRAEIAFYRANLDEGRDMASLHGLRLRCAAVLGAQLSNPPPVFTMVELMLEALVFELYPETVDALSALSRAGHRLAVVSNWDYSLRDTLGRLGILDRFEVVLDSASGPGPKPEPGIFLEALRQLGVHPECAVHCGDVPEADGLGARRAGMEAVILNRSGVELMSWRSPTIDSLEGLPARVTALLGQKRPALLDRGSGASN
jgi:putative hydrolase of the HAD superfamily